MAIVNKITLFNNESRVKLPRKEVTSILTEAVIDYYTKLRYGVYKEIGIIRWGNLRADIFAVSLSGLFVGVEIKSCKSDFDSDHKMTNYLQYFDKFYICCPYYLVDYIKDNLPNKNIGIFTLMDDGYLNCMRPAKVMKGPTQKERNRLLLKLAWRGADYNKRNRPRRCRRYFSK